MLDWGALNDRGPMSSSAAQTLQKLYFTILGVPMDVQMQDLFAKKVAAEGWGWLNSIINDYLGFLAITTSHASVLPPWTQWVVPEK